MTARQLLPWAGDQRLIPQLVCTRARVRPSPSGRPPGLGVIDVCDDPLPVALGSHVPPWCDGCTFCAPASSPVSGRWRERPPNRISARTKPCHTPGARPVHLNNLDSDGYTLRWDTWSQ